MFFNSAVSNKVSYTTTPNIHMCKPSPEEIQSQQPKGIQSLLTG